MHGSKKPVFCPVLFFQACRARSSLLSFYSYTNLFFSKFMKQIFQIRHLGQVFTPPHIVKWMLSLRKNRGRVLEPSCGEGSFLKHLEPQAVGVEVDRHLITDPRVLYMDFFHYSVRHQFDTIIGNPPYVRFQDICPGTKSKLDMSLFDKRTNLYLFFIKKCIEHLKPLGELVFITPRDFLKSTSAAKLNEVLYTQGGMSHFYDLGDESVFKNFSPNCAVWRWVKGIRQKTMRDGGEFMFKSGQLFFSKQKEGESLSDYFDVKVGAVSGADCVFTNKKGNKKFVCSTTAVDKQTRTMIYNTKHKSLYQHKQTLLNRRIKKFNETNWWEWGRRYHEKSGERIYVNCKTRQQQPFFQHDTEAYDGSVLALFPKRKINLTRAVQKLNKTDWQRKGFVCGGRLIFSQRSLQNTPIDLSL